MSRARNHGRRLTPPTALSRFCAAWIILFALSPFTAPFSVCHVVEIVGLHATAPRPTPRRDDFEAWVMRGAELGVEPTVPMATTIAAMSTSNAVGIDASTIADRAVVVPAASFTAVAGPRILVLRV